MPSKRSNDCTVLTGGLIVEYGNYSERNDTYSASTFLKDGRYCMSIGQPTPSLIQVLSSCMRRHMDHLNSIHELQTYLLIYQWFCYDSSLYVVSIYLAVICSTSFCLFHDSLGCQCDMLENLTLSRHELRGQSYAKYVVVKGHPSRKLWMLMSITCKMHFYIARHVDKKG